MTKQAEYKAKRVRQGEELQQARQLGEFHGIVNNVIAAAKENGGFCR